MKINGVEHLYPPPGGVKTFDSAYAESFLEAMQLLARFAATGDSMRLVEIREAAYSMADAVASDLQFRAGPGFRWMPEVESAVSFHAWVSRVLALDRYGILTAWSSG